jgi:hypothetical protein
MLSYYKEYITEAITLIKVNRKSCVDNRIIFEWKQQYKL